MAIHESRLAPANEALASFAHETQIRIGPRGVRVAWTTCGQSFERRWMCRGGQDTYPVWYRRWGHGGTACAGLAQLIRWVRGQPVVPIGTWRRWAAEQIKLLPVEAVEKLSAAGWPAIASCVLCGVELLQGFDWWSLKGVSGPCCNWTCGCRQKAA